MKHILLAFLFAAPAFAQSAPVTLPGEEEVDAYEVSNANAGAKPFESTTMLEAFHGREGISRIVDDLVEQVQKDPRTIEVFRASDFVRLRRTLKEQFCYILNGGCSYTGRDMVKVHEDHGVVASEFNALVELLQDAMDREGVSFGAQNKFLAKLAPMKREVVVR
ncbi:MAG: group 1 truncated hemoglobin [Hyphomonadaceae bacterium]|nr:group 1 truncated hemoglobin [Hyphomonadaceae bacterium]